MITLREHQEIAVNATYNSWSKFKNILNVLPTGAGKTFVMGAIAKHAYANNEVCLVFAHRDVLLSQLSKSLCMMGVHHSFIASKKAIKNVTNANLTRFQNSFYQHTSPVIVVSVDTFLRRLELHTVQPIITKAKYWLMDEAHHVLKNNKWGRCVAPLLNAKGLGVTATPIRADKKGLGAHSDGVFNELIVGATQAELMEKGLLSLYKIYAPPVKINMEGMRLTNTGDWNQKELAKRTDRSDITGDAVKHYLQYANGLQAITFTVNIAHSDHVATQFNQAGIPSVSLSSKTPTPELLQSLTDFEEGRIKNLVNCDLFGEGFDVPAVSAVIMLRKTDSYSLFKQQFGRCLRPSEGKTYGILLDHVGNVKRHCVHGAPHDDPIWTLDAGKLSNDDGEKSLARICPECFHYYIPRIPNQFVCPDCGHEETKAEINRAEQDFQHEEGQLVELEIDFVNQLLAKKAEIDMPVHLVKAKYQGSPAVIRNGQISNHVRRQYAQQILRGHIQEWCTKANPDNLFDKKTVQGKFELEFGVNIYKAQVLSERQAYLLAEKIRNSYV